MATMLNSDGLGCRMVKAVTNCADQDAIWHYYHDGQRTVEVRNGSDSVDPSPFQGEDVRRSSRVERRWTGEGERSEPGVHRRAAPPPAPTDAGATSPVQGEALDGSGDGSWRAFFWACGDDPTHIQADVVVDFDSNCPRS